LGATRGVVLLAGLVVTPMVVIMLAWLMVTPMMLLMVVMFTLTWLMVTPMMLLMMDIMLTWLMVTATMLLIVVMMLTWLMVTPMMLLMVVMMLTGLMVTPVMIPMVVIVVAWFMIARLFHLLVSLQQHWTIPWPADGTFQRLRSNLRIGIGDQVTNAVLRPAINIQNGQMCEMLALRFISVLAFTLALFGRSHPLHLLIISSSPQVHITQETICSDVH